MPASTNAKNIIVRDFRATFLWPLRIKPKHQDLIDKRYGQNSPTQAAPTREWIKEYAGKLVAGESKWRHSGPYGEYAFRLTAKPEPRHRYAEFVYFHPFVQRFIFDESAATHFLHREDIRTAEIQLRPGGATWRFPVERVQLILFPYDVAFVAVQLNHPDNELTLADAQDVLDWCRRIYPPFFTHEGKAGKVPRSMKWLGAANEVIGESDYGEPAAFLGSQAIPVARHWQNLVYPLASDSSVLKYEQVEDDRLPTLAYLAVDHPTAISTPDFVRLAFLDDRGSPDKYPYAREFVEATFPQYCYDRFWSPGSIEGWNSRFLCSGYGLVVIGAHEDNTFRYDISHHMELHYFLLMLIAHLQKTCLLTFSERLSDLVHTFESEPASKKSRETFYSRQKWLVEDMTDFASRIWFPDVSNQVQAIELYELLTKHLRTRELFAHITEQARFVREVQSNQWQEAMVLEQNALAGIQTKLADEQASLARAQTSLAALATSAIPPTIALALLQAVLSIDQVKDSFASVATDMFSLHRYSWQTEAWVLLCAAALFCVFWLGCRKILRQMMKQPASKS